MPVHRNGNGSGSISDLLERSRRAGVADRAVDRDERIMNPIIRAAAILRSGGLVAFPTETVYGLGADATDRQAVLRIFAAKGRPATNPLIVHVPDAAAARRFASHWPASADALAERFWPGPLTLVLPKADAIVHEATAGRGTVGQRAPNHELTLQLLRVCDVPVAGPSANLSNHVSPTTADHVRGEFPGGVIDMVLDGGPCAVGIESTVLDLSSGRPIILRPGGVSREQIEQVIGSVEMFEGTVDAATAAASPGQQARHYAPRTPAVRFQTSQRGLIQAETNGQPNGLIAVGTIDFVHQWERIVAMPEIADVYAREFYRVLRDLDGMSLRTIYIEMPPDTPEWAAVRDRITRATEPMP
jgi:L-threonylcarbamoyladenylate synthase